jgi:autotransporter adhesin
LGTDMDELEEEAFSGVAAAATLASVIEPTAPGKTTVMAGVAHYEGESAVGVNVTHLINWKKLGAHRPTVNAGVSATTADTVLSRVMVGMEF